MLALDRPTLFETFEEPGHPAEYTQVLLPVMAKMLRGTSRVLDPFGGLGGIFSLESWLPEVVFEATEIEPEWAAMHPKTTQADALALPWQDDYFDGICTSPTYGNRMADHHTSKKVRKPKSYKDYLKRQLHPNNSGAMQWGPKYRMFHRKAWRESRRVLKVGGFFILNIKDHIRLHERVYVTQWHVDCLERLGFRLLEEQLVNTPGNTYGANWEARLRFESVLKFVLARKEVCDGAEV